MMNSTDEDGSFELTTNRSNTWLITKFSETDFENEAGGNPMPGLRSPGQQYLVTCENRCKKYEFHAWLTLVPDDWDAPLDREPQSWMSLTLTTTDEWFMKFHAVPEDDDRNVCWAWIAGTGATRECMSRLPGSVHSGSASEFTFYKSEFVLYDDVMNADKGLRVDDQLTIVFEIRAAIDSWLFHPLEPEVADDRDHTLVKDHKRMLDSGQSSDVTLVANDGQEFPAHMSILASRSPVFTAMFEQNMKEKKEKRVEIADLNSQTVRKLLEYIYTDAVPDASWPMADQLLYAAHKYNIPRLKRFSADAMAAELNTENAAEFLSAAELYNAAQLRRAAKYFTVRHISEVKKTQGWQNLQSHSRHLADEIFDELAELVRQLTSLE